MMGPAGENGRQCVDKAFKNLLIFFIVALSLWLQGSIVRSVSVLQHTPNTCALKIALKRFVPVGMSLQTAGILFK